jgi:glycosyltransferase involved in cell wall biosynthesis
LANVNIEFPCEIAPIDIPEALHSAHFFYLTTWGENFGHAIAEALQHGKPVIISNRTPWRNLEEHQAGWDLPLEASSFAPVLQQCLKMEQQEYDALSIAAKQYGRAHAQDPQHLADNYRLFEE